ncbi:SIMPL domain-containing protein [Clostridium sp. HBUAS56017]|uniref:SIMPL domain-containing protein n=1 Tax=Clostridium sp. HBUAS56017 TaxID=2571128 RepID=UPI00117823EE|nr:SIMPL domain-containing protein [Clostridium sp. HBUAS56017]
MYPLGDKDNDKLYDCDNNQCKRIRVLGRGLVNVKPDAAEVAIGVIIQNQDVQLAQIENARIIEQVINNIKRIGVQPENIQTQNYNIRPIYDYVDGKQIFRGYEVSNNINVLIRNINYVGEIIDAAVRSGANSVSGINFIVLDEEKYYYEALSIAVQDAQSKAVVIAKKLGVKLDIIPVQVNEMDTGTTAPLQMMTFKSVGEGTPIEPGENKVKAEVEAIFIYN